MRVRCCSYRESLNSRRLSHKVPADAVDVHPQTIGYIERRQYNPSLAVAFRLAGKFGLSLDAVFSPQAFEPLSDAALKT
ncbi:MAG: helix-turn-helix domain-containing protein [Gammaproteobacteria bacterium]|nr:helix-turn-helix domain-containing protein [Gammaproteobacteria bacterium]